MANSSTGSTRSRVTGRPLRLATIAAASVVIAGFMASPVSAVAGSHAPTRYARVSRAPRVPSGARRIGPANSSNHVSGAVGLAPRNPVALQRAALAVSNPRSKIFHHYIAQGAFAQSYGPAPATIAAVESALRSAHLSVTSVSGNGLLVHFSGTVGQADSAFRTHIASYRLASGRTGTATTTALSLPASVASQVVGVIGLNTLVAPSADFEHATHPATRKPVTHSIPHYPGAPAACTGATTAANEAGGLTDDQIANAYGVDGLYKAGDTGAGQTVAVYELEPFAKADVKAFDNCYFGKTAAAAMAGRLSVKTVDGGAGTGEGSGESILDVEDVAGLAPGAKIEVYEAPLTNQGALDEYNAIVQQDTAQVVTTSWGVCEADAISGDPGSIGLENEVFEQAALQGQTVFSSSGDAGADSCAYDAPVPEAPTLSTSDPSSQPFVTSVGGTTITNAKNPPSEQVWNDGSGAGGAGGGVSSVWGAPSWQQPFLDTAAAANAVTNGGMTPCEQSANAGLCRELPDVSAQADQYTGAITVYAREFGWTTFGGTSSSTPLWAAMLADINASSGCTATGRVGFASPSLYAVASIPADYKASFNDVTAGNNDVFDLSHGALYKAHTGYDMASGLGTPMVTGPKGQAGLADFLCATAAPAARPSITSLAPATEPTTPVGSLTVHGTGFTGAKALSIGGFDVPAADWSATGATTIVVSPVPTAAQVGTGSLGPQDGTGRAIVSVTGSTGAPSLVSATGSLLYVDGTAAVPDPSVAGVMEPGGSMAGGDTVTVFGSGFTSSAITGVTVGGVPASHIDVLNADALTITVPAYSSGTTACKAGDDTVNDVCQAQVVVSNINGPSPTATIEPPYTGAPFEGVSGGVPLPACVSGHTCEIVPADSEYDYFVAPRITSVTTTSAGDPTTWVSEQGTTIATIDGKGFDDLGFEWVNIGDPTLAVDQDANVVTITPTEVQVVINPHNPTTEPVTHQLTVQTLGGLSAKRSISYAGVPRLTAIHPAAAPDTGGTHLTITGKGFQGVSPADGGELSYFYVEAPISTDQHSNYAATSDTTITGHTPQTNPGLFFVSVCTITFCSFPTSQSSFNHSLIDFFQPGDPVVRSVSAKSGPASGGTKVVIKGKNLSDAVKVRFGKAVAEAASAPELLTNGSSTEIDALAPPGKAGTKVDITVTTVESRFNGKSSAKTAAATFRYTASVPAPPRHVAAKAHDTSLTVRWKPPASNGGHPITGYRVSAVSFANSDKKGAKKPPTVFVLTKTARARSAKLTGLRGGWDYRVKVQAVNRLGRGLPGMPERIFFIHEPA
jgi:Pro-kumamolisin, activation domain/Fibronectin type III domain/IPT/TIG domain